MSPNDQLLQQIEAFLVATGKTPSAFGKEAVGDTNLVADLRNEGRELRWKTRRRVEGYMTEFRARVTDAVSAARSEEAA
jgi:hypothetical protein